MLVFVFVFVFVFYSLNVSNLPPISRVCDAPNGENVQVPFSDPWNLEGVEIEFYWEAFTKKLSLYLYLYLHET